jgi:hypothetical protein
MLIPMDESGQTNHLKAYGIAFLVLTKNEKIDWLLNYKGGSFVFDYFFSKLIKSEIFILPSTLPEINDLSS